MGEQQNQPDQPSKPGEALPPRRFPWMVIVVPVLFIAVAYLTSRDWRGDMQEGSLRRKAEELVVNALPGSAPAEVTVVKVETHKSSATVSGTAVSTEYSGQKRRHNWHVSFYNDRGNVKTTEWKITPE
jgi:hypothetical protein